ncbi:MAG: nucleotidyl transferase AbiEii/AbiGii toxin family protein [Candidatus Beckwithbacteria bacterium]|nr:nucleotidyl transferase AbiEii/AbiGii toxin family protein [Patescibacteria group bacterium]
MIDQQFLKNYAIKSETSLINILREYAQHLFLRQFYQQKNSQHFLFKGGTALRLAFNSPRFSEDLDFSAYKNSDIYESLLENALLNLHNEGITVEFNESKTTSGGHLSIIQLSLFNQTIQIHCQISFRSKTKLIKENVVINSNLIPSYNLYILDRQLLVNEKLTALLDRQKPRDFFDLYFILRQNSLRPLLNINPRQRKQISNILSVLPKNKLAVELKELMPKSFLSVIKNLPLMLKKELGG